MIKLFVFDTNSLISANLSPDSVNRTAYDLARKLGIAVYSDSTLTEFADTLLRPKFDKYITRESRILAINAFKASSQQIIVDTAITACRDPKDDKYLALAVEVTAACIITGDKDLLVLNPFRNIPILTASQFLELFSV